MMAFIAAFLLSLLLSIGGQTVDRCQLHRREFNPVRVTIPGLVPIGVSLNGDPVSGYYFNANTGCYGYLLRIGGTVSTERYYEPGE